MGGSVARTIGCSCYAPPYRARGWSIGYYGVDSNVPNMVMLCPGNVHTNWYVPASGATKLTNALSPAANRGALATTFVSSGATQLLSWPAPKPAVATWSLVPSCTRTQLCC